MGAAGLPSPFQLRGSSGWAGVAGWTGSGRNRWWQSLAEDAVPQGEPDLGPGPVRRHVQHRLALRLAIQAGTVIRVRRRVAPRSTAWTGPAIVPAARSRWWVIAAHRVQALLAANRPDGRCANGPSIRSANTVSMMACRRWVMSAWLRRSRLLVKNGGAARPGTVRRSWPGPGPDARSAGR